MKVTGAGSEGLMAVIPLAVLLVFAMTVTGGPEGLLKVVNSYLGEFVRAAYEWVSSVVS